MRDKTELYYNPQLLQIGEINNNQTGSMLFFVS